MVHQQSYLSSKLSSREKNKYIFVTCFVILKNATYFLLIWIFFVVIKIDNFLQLDFSANIIPVYFLLLWYIMVYCLEWLIIDILLNIFNWWEKGLNKTSIYFKQLWFCFSFSDRCKNMQFYIKDRMNPCTILAFSLPALILSYFYTSRLFKFLHNFWCYTSHIFQTPLRCS